jgi:hypothetical protein
MKMKICAIMIVALFIGAHAASFAGAEELGGTIDIDINDASGGIASELNLSDNQTIDIMVESDGVNYTVNTTLSINLTIEDNSERGAIPWFFPRWAFVYTHLSRPEQFKAPFFPIFRKGGLVYRLFPLLNTGGILAGGTLHKLIVVESVIGSFFKTNVSTSVDIPIYYDITDLIGEEEEDDSQPKILSKGFSALNTATLASEKIVLRLATIGFPPSNVNGFEFLHFVDYQTINLTVNYLSPII